MEHRNEFCKFWPHNQATPMPRASGEPYRSFLSQPCPACPMAMMQMEFETKPHPEESTMSHEVRVQANFKPSALLDVLLSNKAPIDGNLPVKACMRGKTAQAKGRVGPLKPQDLYRFQYRFLLQIATKCFLNFSRPPISTSHNHWSSQPIPKCWKWKMISPHSPIMLFNIKPKTRVPNLTSRISKKMIKKPPKTRPRRLTGFFSKVRPGRNKALSKMSARLVPARTTTPVAELKPSISTNIWFLGKKTTAGCEKAGCGGLLFLWHDFGPAFWLQ